MTKRFKECLQFVLKWEGGYSNHPNDPGGATNMGITQSVYNAWRGSKGLPPQDVRKITKEEVERIYWERYWTALRCDEIPRPLDIAVFDTGVNCGVGRAARWLNSILGISPPTTKITNTTIEKLKKVDIIAVTHRFLQQRELHYHSIAQRNKKLQVFLKGWLNRLNDLRKQIAKQKT